MKGILATVGRATFPPDALYKIVAPTSGSAKQVAAYNLCDGQLPKKDICKKLKLDFGNFSRSVTSRSKRVSCSASERKIFHSTFILYPNKPKPKRE